MTPNSNAFPVVIGQADDFEAHHGLTKREYFAGLALQGLTAGLEAGVGQYDPNAIAMEAIALADALINGLKYTAEVESDRRQMRENLGL